MKKVLIFSLAYYPHVGGAEVAIKELTDRMSDIEFHMVTMRFSAAEPREEKIGNVFVHRVGIGSSYISKILYVPRATLAARTLGVQDFDGAWAMMSYMTFPITLLRLFFGIRVPYVLTLQEGDPFEHVFQRWYIRLFSPLLNSGFRHASVITALSNFLATWPRSQGFKNGIAIIPNGVDVKKFSGALMPHEGTVLITTSRLVHKNAVDDVIRALAMLPADVRFKVLGTGPDESALKMLAQKEGVADRVEFLGFIKHDDMPGHLHRADLYIRPSRSEGQGASFIEAMAAGLPLLATMVGGIPDFLVDGETGFAVEVDNPKSIADGVKKAIAQPELVRAISERNKQRAGRYDWDILAARMRQEAFEPLWQKQ